MKCLLKLILLLYLSRDTSHSPLQGICPSKQYCHSCQRGNVVCTIPHTNITALQTGPFTKPIDKLILDGCPDNFTSSNTQFNVTSLHVNCTINNDFFALFHRWNLKEIKDINRNELYFQVSPGTNQTCQQACGETRRPVNGSSSCICIGDANLTESDKNNFYYYIIIGGVSGFTLLVNLIFIIGMCTLAQSSLVGVFGTALMFFNILLALYGIAMATYLTQNHTYWHHQFCQGFTSVKLFALGTSVWTMMMLTYHRSVRADIETEREAIFKGIVYILEGLMLSGVLAVMSWIKLDKWDYLCIIFKPKTTVDWLLTGIELLYYFMMLCLILRFPYHQIRKKKRTGNQRIDTSVPIFLMVMVCFTIWLGGYGITMHWFEYLFTEQIRRVIRVVAIILPVSLQPIIFVLRNTCCCLCRDPPCSKKKDDVIKICECIPPNESCDICDNEDYVMRYSANETPYGEKEPNGDVKEMVDLKAAKKAKKKKEKKEKKKKKGKGGKFFAPKSIERSPLTKHKETSFNEDGVESDQGENAVAETPLIDKDDKAATEADHKQEEETQRKSVGIATDSTPLLDDTDGEVRQPPKATPEGTPKKLGVTPDYPSFVHMDAAIDVDSLPKEKAPKTFSKIAATNNAVKTQQQQQEHLKPDPLEEERKSRGPTFFPLAEKPKDSPAEPKPVKKKPKKKSKKSEKSNGKKNGEKEAPKKSKTKKCSRSERENGEKVPGRNSIVSLEWDHYSDCSSGSVSRSSDYFPDDLTVLSVTENTENSTETQQKQLPLNTQSNGISRTGSKKSENMEWDPIGGVQQSEKSNDEISALKNNKNKGEIPTAKTNGKMATTAS